MNDREHHNKDERFYGGEGGNTTANVIDVAWTPETTRKSGEANRDGRQRLIPLFALFVTT